MSVMLFMGTTLFPTITDPSVIQEVLYMGWCDNSLFFHKTRLKLNSDGTIYMNIYNFIRARGFESKFPFNGLIILEHMLASKVVIIYVFLICL